ncbi:MAG: DUF58 domain-containing protein [Vicinamibacterales bacterium]|nr:DUF58 domain-containing protein [Vicinamibacterales bacterium]
MPPPRDPEALLRRLEWTVIRRLDGLLHGDYGTLFRGAGLDLADLREYQLNDDVRHIDWNVTARLQHPHVRQYQEDREVTAWFLLDVSASVDFGSETVTKRAVLTDFVAVLARLLTRHGNRVGALLFDGAVEATLPPRSSRTHVLHLLRRLLSPSRSAPTGTTDLAAMLQAALGIITRRSVVFVVSDFVSPAGWVAPLRQLAARHDVLAVRLFDPLEIALPDVGLLVMQDAETGEQLVVDTTDAGFRERFAAAAARRDDETRAMLQRAGVDTLELATDDHLVDAIVRFSDLRRRRTQLASGGGLPAHLEARA